MSPPAPDEDAPPSVVSTVVPADWGLPLWAQRQNDPTSPAFLSGGGLPDPTTAPPGWSPTNRVARNWVVVGTLGRPLRAVVDPRGLITPAEGSWSLDWWVGGEDRWHLPAREATVRQRLVEDAPVVETAMRVHGGDVVQRVFAAVGADAQPWLVVEVENRTSAAVALAMAIRPWGPEGASAVGSVAVEGDWIIVDEVPAVALPRAPWRTYVAGEGDDPVIAQVLSGADGPSEVRLTCAGGAAELAAVVPLPHTLVARFALPLGRAPKRPRRAAVRSEAPPALPTAAEVAAGWSSVAARGPAFEVPEPALATVVAAARRQLLGVPAGEDLLWWGGGAVDLTSWVPVLEALAVWGGAEEAAGVLRSWEERQALDGRFLGNDRRRATTAAALVALGNQLRLTADTDQVGAWAPVAAKAAAWLDRRATSRRHRADPATLGLLPEGDQPWWVGPAGLAYRDSWWALAGLHDAAGVLAAAGEHEAAAASSAAAERLRVVLEGFLADDAARLGSDVVPVGPGQRPGPGALALLDAAIAGVIDPQSARVSATLDFIRHQLVDDDGAVVVYPPVRGAGPVGRSAALTARLARVELRRGESSAIGRLRWLALSATGAVSWPEVMHPLTGGGVVGAGHDPVATAEMLLAMADLLAVVSPGGDDVALAPVVPPTWLGQSWEVHDLPTPAGRLGYAVRWHGDRPAVLWELDRVEGAGSLTVRAPGLDPLWSSTERSGEALLGPVAPLPDERDAPAVPGESPEPPAVDPPVPHAAQERGPGSRADAPGPPGARPAPPDPGGGFT